MSCNETKEDCSVSIARAGLRDRARRFSLEAVEGSTFILNLKALDTFGNCQRPVFSIGVSKYYAQNNKSGLICLRSCKRILNEKTPFVAQICVLSDA